MFETCLRLHPAQDMLIEYFHINIWVEDVVEASSFDFVMGVWNRGVLEAMTEAGEGSLGRNLDCSRLLDKQSGTVVFRANAPMDD